MACQTFLLKREYGLSIPDLDMYFSFVRYSPFTHFTKIYVFSLRGIFPLRTVPLTSAEKHLNFLTVTRMNSCVFFCSISWYVILLSTFYISQLTITVNFTC